MGLTYTEIAILISPYLVTIFIGFVVSYKEDKKQIRKLKRANKNLSEELEYYKSWHK